MVTYLVAGTGCQPGHEPGCWLEPLASSCDLGFLATWWLGAKREGVRWQPCHLFMVGTRKSAASLGPHPIHRGNHKAPAMFKCRGNRLLLLKGAGGKVLEEHVGPTRSIAVAIFEKDNVPRSHQLPGEEMKLGQVQISITSCN